MEEECLYLAVWIERGLLSLTVNGVGADDSAMPQQSTFRKCIAP